MTWEMTVGLEVHTQLNTVSKLFCSCKTSFGAPPNTHTCEICQGHPGVLPKLNEAALEKAVTAGLALHCTVNTYSKFDRKNYFYPDLPKAYQISQYDQPICSGGYIDIGTVSDNTECAEPAEESKETAASVYKGNARIRLTRIHLEEDAGKLVHSPHHAESYIDLNRAGTPLIEIVTEPDIHSPAEAVEFLQKLRAILLYLEISDCNMEAGSFRCDANISLRRKGSTVLGNRTEIKNMNTFKGIFNALEYEYRRQEKILNAGNTVVTETLLFDSVTGKTQSMRGKEEAHDYRYFPEPDLPPIRLNESYISRIGGLIPELPDNKKKRFQNDYGLSCYDSGVLISDKHLAVYFEKAAEGYPAYAKKICNWILTEVMSVMNETKTDILHFPVKPEEIGKLMHLVESGVISGRIAKDVFPELCASGKSIDALLNEKKLSMISDDELIREILKKLLAENPAVVQKYKEGNTKTAGFFVGQVMKETGGKGNPKKINVILAELLQ